MSYVANFELLIGFSVLLVAAVIAFGIVQSKISRTQAIERHERRKERIRLL